MTALINLKVCNEVEYLSTVCAIPISPYSQDLSNKTNLIFSTLVDQCLHLILGESESLNGDVTHRDRRNLPSKAGKFIILKWLHLGIKFGYNKGSSLELPICVVSGDMF